MKLLFAAALVGSLPLALQAHDFRAGDVVIGHPYAFSTVPVARTAAGYMTLTNEGDSPATLVGVETEASGKAEVHQSKTDGGVATMTPVPRLEIAPGETVTFEPGSYHVMFMGLTAPFEEGASVPATLIFEPAGAVEVTFSVEARTGGAGEGHGGHGDDEGHGGHDSH